MHTSHYNGLETYSYKDVDLYNNLFQKREFESNTGNKFASFETIFQDYIVYNTPRLHQSFDWSRDIIFQLNEKLHGYLVTQSILNVFIKCIS